MRMFIGSMVAILVALVTAGDAVAAGRFDVIGAGCVPDSTAIFGALHANASGGVSHASGKTGTVTLYCPIPNASSLDPAGPKTLQILYTDNSFGSGEQVVVTLFKINNSNGVLTAIATVNSDHNGCSQGGPRTCSASFTEPLDATKNIYFLGVFIARSSTSSLETFWGASVF